MVNKMKRILKHLLMPGWLARRVFNAGVLDRLEQAIRHSEPQHGAELRLVIEGELHLHALLRTLTPHRRAIELFSVLRVWDTEQNNGVLTERDILRKVHPERMGHSLWKTVYKGLLDGGWCSDQGTGKKGDPKRLVLIRAPEEDD